MRVLLILLLFIINGLSDDVIPVGFKLDRYTETWEKNPFYNLITPVKRSGKFILLSWYKDIGEKISIQDTETKVIQEVNNVPNKDHWSITNFHNDPDPHLVEVIISNGTEIESVKFNFNVDIPPPEENIDKNNNRKKR